MIHISVHSKISQRWIGDESNGQLKSGSWGSPGIGLPAARENSHRPVDR
jgi:hypothetical protein